MLEVDSLTFVLVSELTIGLLVGVILYLVWLIRRKNREQAAVRSFIERLRESENERVEALKQRLRELTNAKDEVLAPALDELCLQEKTLYKQVIDIFLHHNVKSLAAIDSRVRAIMEPFYKLLAEAKGVDESVLHDLQKARRVIGEQTERIKQLRFESSQLSEQLTTALETLDEVSSEYSKMFGESKSAEELEVSQKKILNVFRQAEMKVKQIALDRGADTTEAL